MTGLKMRIPTNKLQQLAIFTTLVTGGAVSTMYYLMQKKFAESDYHKLAVQKLEACTVAMESLGAPPLKVHNIRLTDRDNRVDHHTAQMKIPVSGSRTGGYLYTTSSWEPGNNRWRVKMAVLRLKEGDIMDLTSTHTDDHVNGVTQEGCS
ncbi:cytochrome c oxidase assembly factor 1 homolog isoform X1 [Nerophis lumbriciformis]|uniref:cytochrome c oxidase assembly factor 1 homolog isoform X1 n=2 Tax=Nerophis lumbriciformis TaxID=546530 RepID=UPI002ADFA6AE|nr:cytochrome c oxidase assembly factor 1 homolog isoform X1 [Nerophis lumbriciformis]